MRVNRPDRSTASASTRSSKKAGNTGASFSLSSAEEPSQAQGAGGLQSIGGVDGLLSLQEVPDSTDRNKSAYKRGEDMLDMLEDLKLGLLVGVIPMPKLRELLAMVEKRRDEVSDPGLGKILDEIELRARVELAKLGKIAA